MKIIIFGSTGKIGLLLTEQARARDAIQVYFDNSLSNNSLSNKKRYNNMVKARIAVIFIDLIMAGILAGLFLTYAFTIMPALATTDDRTFVAAFQGLERMFGGFEYGINWPVLGFVGVPLITVVAIAQNRSRSLVWWLVAALVLSIATILITFTFHVPLNNALIAAGDPATIDVAQVRADFRESSWRAWNLVRSATTLGAFVCLCLVLFLHGQKTPETK